MRAIGVSVAVACGAMTLALSGVAFAEPHSVSANIGAVSNYMWRGTSQTDNGPAIQGGMDYAHESGFSAGTWLSNVDFGDDTNYELDLYTGFSGAITEDFSYDLNLTYYAYPDGRDLDFAELGVSFGYQMVSLGASYTFYGQADDADGAIDDEATFIEGDLYYNIGIDVPLPYELGLSLYGGYYDFRYNDGGNDYGHWGASISREAGDFGTFSLNYDQVNRDTYDDDPKFWVGWVKEF